MILLCWIEGMSTVDERASIGYVMIALGWISPWPDKLGRMGRMGREDILALASAFVFAHCTTGHWIRYLTLATLP